MSLFPLRGGTWAPPLLPLQRRGLPARHEPPPSPPKALENGPAKRPPAPRKPNTLQPPKRSCACPPDAESTPCQGARSTLCRHQTAPENTASKPRAQDQNPPHAAAKNPLKNTPRAPPGTQGNRAANRAAQGPWKPQQKRAPNTLRNTQKSCLPAPFLQACEPLAPSLVLGPRTGKKPASGLQKPCARQYNYTAIAKCEIMRFGNCSYTRAN